MTLDEAVAEFKARRLRQKQEREAGQEGRLGRAIKKFLTPEQEDQFNFQYKGGYAHFTCAGRKYRLLFGDNRWYLSGEVREGYGVPVMTILLEIDTEGIAYADSPLYDRLIEYLAS